MKSGAGRPSSTGKASSVRRAVGVVRVSRVGDRDGDRFVSPREQTERIQSVAGRTVRGSSSRSRSMAALHCRLLSARSLVLWGAKPQTRSRGRGAASAAVAFLRFPLSPEGGEPRRLSESHLCLVRIGLLHQRRPLSVWSPRFMFSSTSSNGALSPKNSRRARKDSQGSIAQPNGPLLTPVATLHMARTLPDAAPATRSVGIGFQAGRRERPHRTNVPTPPARETSRQSGSEATPRSRRPQRCILLLLSVKCNDQTTRA